MAEADAAPASPDIAAFVERMNGCCRTLVAIGTPDALVATGAVSADLSVTMPGAKESDDNWI